MKNLVLAGGSGTRLWPLSRTSYPKQFVRLFNDKSLFQETLNRNAKLANSITIVTNTEQYFLAFDQMHEWQSEYDKTQNTKPNQQLDINFIVEPIAKNTAPAVALACLTMDPEELVLVTPSDHLIKDLDAYENAVLKAKELAALGFIVTFGIQPKYPEPGFGYIQANGNEVISFTEKPDLETAKQYLDQGGYYWNSGMFCFKAGVFLDELKKYKPEMHDSCVAALNQSVTANDLIRIDLASMQDIDADSIDYAVMERSDLVKMVACDPAWSDMGSYDAIYAELKSEDTENAIKLDSKKGKTPVLIDSGDNLVVSENRTIALVGVNDFIIVDTPDALLISQKNSSDKLRQVVQKLNLLEPDMVKIHNLVHRPWGTYEVLVENPGYKVKRIVVKSGHSLSLQKHFHRSEHWVVVSGTANVRIDEKEFMLRQNESTFIKAGQVHRLLNQGKIDLVIIEAQVGEYTGEDDILRLDDDYLRS